MDVSPAGRSRDDASVASIKPVALARAAAPKAAARAPMSGMLKPLSGLFVVRPFPGPLKRPAAGAASPPR